MLGFAVDDMSGYGSTRVQRAGPFLNICNSKGEERHVEGSEVGCRAAC
jgi:hypothetical protein